MAHLIAVSIAHATRFGQIWYNGNPIPVTVSIGVASSTGLSKTSVEKEAASLLKRADIALYAAKTSGRDQAVVYDEIHALPKRIAA